MGDCRVCSQPPSHNGTKCRGQPGGPRGKSHMLATARSTVPLTWVPTSAHANPSWFAPGPPPLKAACSPQQGLPAKADKPIVVRAGLPFQNSGAVPPPEAEPSRVTGATSGGATLLGAIPRPDTRLTTRPTQTASLPGLVSYCEHECGAVLYFHSSTLSQYATDAYWYALYMYE